MSFRFSKGSIAIIIVIIVVATVLATVSYQYSTSTADAIFKIASDDVRSNAEIQAGDLAAILINKLGGVSANLQVMADAPAVQNKDVQDAAPLFNSARESTSDFTSSYFWVDSNGKLLWADAFTNSTIAQQYRGDDRTFRDYYSKPKETLEPYYSAVVVSVDGVPRMYVSHPILGTVQEGVKEFKGVVVAAVDLDVLGRYLQSQLSSSKYQSTTGMIDKNGTILYSSDTSMIGKDIFGPEFQVLLPAELKDTFNNFLRRSLAGQAGSGDFSYRGNTSTIAYQPVLIQDNSFAVLYVVAPHQLAGNVFSLVEGQRTFTTILIAVVGAVAGGIALLVLVWNKRLSELVASKTEELRISAASVTSSNKQLEKLNRQLASANEQLVTANEQLQMNDKMQREFINIAAHELRTPTQAILGYSDLFEMQPETRDEAMKAVSRNAMRLERLTQDILDVSRIEGRALELNKEAFDISDVISVALQDAKRQVANGDIKFVYASPDNIMIEADKARITQVVSNLLNNAIKFTKKGTIKVSVERDLPGQIRVSVEDSGTGIHPEMQPR
ncbi:MAG TPA: sensor histidine kinase, partial [Nitrososphaera sp.]|nr:sensor histidine kinase [Nitrososphaera sp.]